MHYKNCSRLIVGLIALLAGTVLSAADYAGTIGESKTPLINYADSEPAHSERVTHPYKQLVPTLTPHIPMHVRPHSRDVMTDIEDRPFFDYNAWQTFIGLIWPAERDVDHYVRGLADGDLPEAGFREIYATGDYQAGNWVAVFETLRTNDELFTSPADGEVLSMPPEPIDWFADAYSLPLELEGVSKTGHVDGDTFDEAFSGPLIDQNRRYVRYTVAMNRVFYDYIRDNGYFWKGNFPKSPSAVPIPPVTATEAQSKSEDPVVLMLQPQTQTIATQRVHGNSITIKTAWRVMITDPTAPWEQQDDLSRYYTTEALVKNPSNPNADAEKAIVGLVGLHVVVRTTQFPQGLWSTFSHIDNLPPIGMKSLPDGRRASFNSNGKVFYPDGFSYQPGNDFPDIEDRVPVEVSRLWKIPNTPVPLPQDNGKGYSTQAMNAQFQDLLKGTVWEHYQLEVTNWPTDPGVFYARPFFQMRGMSGAVTDDMPPALQAIIKRNNLAESDAFPRYAGLPIPQVGALNPILETYFQNSEMPEQTSCIGCHYGASDLGFVWAWKKDVWPQPYKQGRVNPEDTQRAAVPYVTASDYNQ